MIDAFTPLGVGSEYSWMLSGCRAGHFWVMGKVARLVMLDIFPQRWEMRLNRVSARKLPVDWRHEPATYINRK